MKSLILLLIMVEFIVANSLVIKDANVSITINKNDYILQKGDKVELEYNSTICFKDGDGRVIINEQLQLSLKSKEKCSHINTKKSFNFKSWLKKNIKVIALLFTNSKEQTKVAVTRKGGKPETANGTMVLKASDKYLVIANKTWSPLPITLKIFNNKGLEVYTDINNKDDKTLFIISHEFLKDGYRVVVFDCFGDLFVDVALRIRRK